MALARVLDFRTTLAPPLSIRHPPGFFPPSYRYTCIMEPFDLSTLNGLHLVSGLCDGVLTGAEALAGFPQSTLSLISPSSDSMVSMESKQIDGGAHQDPLR